MPDQKRIAFEETDLRGEMAERGLLPAEIELLVLIRRDGERRPERPERLWELSVSKRHAAKRMRCSPNTVVAAAGRLARRGVLTIVPTGSSPIYVLSVDRLVALELPPDPVAGVELFPPDDGGGGQGWSGRHPCNRETVGIPNREPVNRNRVDRNRGRADHAPDGGPRSPGLTTSVEKLLEHPTPWRLVEDGHVRLLDRRLLGRLFQELVTLGEAHDTYDDRRLFFALAFHSASTVFRRAPTSAHPRVACLRANFRRRRRHFCSDDAWQWAGRQIAEMSFGASSLSLTQERAIR